MNAKYTEFVPIYRPTIKKAIGIRIKTEDDYWSVVKEWLIKQSLYRPFEQVVCLAGRASCEWLWLFRKMKHYYLDAGLADFMAGAVKEITDEYFKALPECERHKSACRGGGDVGGFVIHLPAGEAKSSIMVLPRYTVEDCNPGKPDILEYYAFVCNDESASAFNASNCMEINNAEEEGAIECRRVIKIVLGFALYISAFPDSILSHRSEDKTENAKRISLRVVANDIVKHESNMARSPHWRRGHFRLLSSPVFKNKQFSTIYIRGVFVRGTASDVI